MLPPAPARFSTTNCWPRLSLSFAPTILAMMSTGPPGAKGTMRRTGLFGQSCAKQVPASAHAASATESFRLMNFLLLLSVILSPPMRRDSSCDKVAARVFPSRLEKGISMPARKLTRQDLRDAAEKYKNGGKGGPADEIGTLNHTRPEDIVAAARLVKKGKVISLALNFDNNGPQGAKSSYPAMGRINPVHTMLRTGTDAYSGVLDKRGIRAADDMVVMPLQCGTQWDGLGHVFYENSMWNGYDCREVTSNGAQKCGIEKTKNKMVGRGVFLDVARALGQECLEDGYGITCEDLNNAAEAQGVTVQRGDYVVVRTGQMERCLKAKSWDGYPGGDAPGFAFETLEWVARTQLAALASDTWGCEVRPNETEPGINQPWHWITIPMMGMTMGEIFYVKDLAEDCAQDKVYEFMFVAPALPITGAVGSPTNPLAIK